LLAGGKGKIFFYTHHPTQVANMGQFGKNHFDFGNIKDFHLLKFENAHLGVKEEDETLYKISL